MPALHMHHTGDYWKNEHLLSVQWEIFEIVIWLSDRFSCNFPAQEKKESSGTVFHCNSFFLFLPKHEAWEEDKPTTIWYESGFLLDVHTN